MKDVCLSLGVFGLFFTSGIGLYDCVCQHDKTPPVLVKAKPVCERWRAVNVWHCTDGNANVQNFCRTYEAQTRTRCAEWSK